MLLSSKVISGAETYSKPGMVEAGLAAMPWFSMLMFPPLAMLMEPVEFTVTPPVWPLIMEGLLMKCPFHSGRLSLQFEYYPP